MRATRLMWAAVMLLAAAPSSSSAQAARTCFSRLTDYLPPRAQELNISGHAIIHCTIGDDGSYSDCSLKSEEPTNLGFGQAALRMACLFRAPIRADGKVEAVGELIERRIDFRPEKTCSAGSCSFGGSVKVSAPTIVAPSDDTSNK